jgi:hypothetical protein
VTRRLGPLLSLALLLGLGAWVYLREVGPGAPKQGKSGGEERAIPFERADLKSIAIANEHGPLGLKKDGEAWTITAPLATAADRDGVEGLIASLETARIERRLGPQKDLKSYGLDPAAATITLELASSPAPSSIAVGASNPIGGTRFVLLPGGADVAVVGASIGDTLSKTLLSLRDKSLLSFDPWKVQRFAIERGRVTIRLSKPEDGWKIEQPVETPADGPAVSDILSALERTQIREFVLEKAADRDLPRYGLAPPAARLTLRQEGWDVDKTVLFGKTAGGDRYARTVGRDPVVKVPDDIWTKLTTGLFDLRRKDLLGVGQYRIETITAARDGGPGLVLARQKDGGWLATGRTSGSVKSETVDALLRVLAGLKAVAFDDHPPATLRSSLSRRPALDLLLQEEKDATTGAARSQHLVIGPPRAGRAPAIDLAWRPLAFVPRNEVDAVLHQLDLVAAEASAPKPAASPSASASPAAVAPDASATPSQ